MMEIKKLRSSIISGSNGTEIIIPKQNIVILIVCIFILFVSTDLLWGEMLSWPGYIYVFGTHLCILLWNLTGKEIITVTDKKLTIKKVILKFGKSKEYDLNNVKNMRPSSGHWGISFDYGKKTCRFGYGIKEVEAKYIISVLLKGTDKDIGKQSEDFGTLGEMRSNTRRPKLMILSGVVLLNIGLFYQIYHLTILLDSITSDNAPKGICEPNIPNFLQLILQIVSPVTFTLFVLGFLLLLSSFLVRKKEPEKQDIRINAEIGIPGNTPGKRRIKTPGGKNHFRFLFRPFMVCMFLFIAMIIACKRQSKSIPKQPI